MSDLKKVLIIVDEEDKSILSEQNLHIEEFDTIMYSNGNDALSVLEEKRDEIALVMRPP